MICAGVQAQAGTAHFDTDVGGQVSHHYVLDGFGAGGANKSGTGTKDSTKAITWSTNANGDLTIKENGAVVAQLTGGGNVGSGNGTEGGVQVHWTNIDFEQPAPE